MTPERVGAYRANPRPQPKLPRLTPWWRLALWRLRGGPERLRARRIRHGNNRVWRALIDEWLEQEQRWRAAGCHRARTALGSGLLTEFVADVTTGDVVETLP